MRGDPVARRRLAGWRLQQLPAIVELTDDRAIVLLEMKAGDALIYAPGTAEPMWVTVDELEPAFTGHAVAVEADPSQERAGERPWDKARRTHWFWSEVWKVRREFWPVLLAALIVNLLALALPLFTMNVYDRVIPNKAVPTLWVLAIGVMMALIFDFVLRVARGQLVDEIGRKLDAKYSQKLFEKVMNLPMAERQGSTGAFAKRVSEYEGVRDFFASTSVVLMVDIVFLVIFLVLITVLAGPLVLVPLIGITIMFGLGITLQKRMAGVAQDAQADSSLQHSVLVESIAGIETLKSSRAEGQMLGRWRRYASMSAATQEKMRRVTAVAVNSASICQQAISVGLVIGGFYLFQKGDITMGAIIAIVMLAGRAMSPIGQFAFLVTRARQSMTTMESLQRMMEATDERQVAARSIVPEIRVGHVELKNASFRYPAASVDSLNGINLKIEPGERIAIIGRVASGKSTLGRMLCGLYAPTDGEMLVDGLDSRQYHPHQLRDSFRFVGQDAELFSGTVRDNLMLGAARAEDQQLIDAVVRSGALIGPYARLRPGADIGEDAHIGNFVEVKKVAVGKGAKANHLSYLGDGTVGAGANIGAGTIFCNYDGFFKYDTHVGEGAFIGSNTALVAPVTVGPGGYTGSGSVITKDVAADALAVERGQQVERPGWAAAFRKRKQAERAAKGKK